MSENGKGCANNKIRMSRLFEDLDSDICLNLDQHVVTVNEKNRC